jgi:hypothetical protein
MGMIGHHHRTLQVNAILMAVANRGQHDVARSGRKLSFRAKSYEIGSSGY